MLRRTLLLSLALVVVFAAPAAAHVTASSPDASPGGFGKVVFRVPNERDDASTTSVELTFEDTPFASLGVKPVPGWTATLQRNGEDQVVGVTWAGGTIGPGEFQEFEISGGQFPDTDTMTFFALQTYDSGEVVRWVEPTPEGGEEPENPAPTLSLTGESADDHGDGEATATTEAAPAPSSDDDDDEDDGDTRGTVLGIAGIALGAIALGVALSGRRRAA